MKKYIVLILLSAGSYQSHSQILISLLFGDKLNSDKIEFGLEGGVNWSMISSLESKKTLPTFNLGLYFDIKIKKSWYLYTGVLVKSNLGSNRLTASDLIMLQAPTYPVEGVYSQRMNYFLMPALAKYQFKNRIYLEAGPQAGLMTKAWIEYNSDQDHTSATIKTDNTDNINRFDLGVVGGFGYKFQKHQGMSIGLKYYYGFLDVYKDISGSHNSSLFLKLNIPIGAGKKKTAGE